MSNLELWESVSKTDPTYTKHVNQRGGYTAISPQYQALKATEQFGAYGKGWGLSHSDFNFDVLETTGMIIHRAIFFYILDGDRVEFPIHNAIKPCHKSQNGVYADEDWAKKVETNTISKALSKLGFCADVFMGLFDDQGYVDYVGGEFAIEKADNADEEREKQRQQLQDYHDDMIKKFGRALQMSELEGLYKSAVRKFSHRNRNDLIQSITKAKDENKARLESNE